jgi:hypothetical protein
MYSNYLLKVFLLVCFSGFYSLGVQAQNNSPVPPQPPSAETSIARDLKLAGIVNCRDLALNMTKLISGNKPATAMVTVGPDNANLRMFTVSMENFFGQNLSFTSASYAPYLGGGCGAEFETVTFFKASCDQLLSELTKPTVTRQNATKPLVLGAKIFISNSGPNMHNFLMPVSGGCVQIHKEMIL